MSSIADLVAAGKEIGIFQFYLPFVLLFSILYGLLQKSKIFGEKAKPINVIISLAASAFIMEYALAAAIETFFAAFFAGTLGILAGILGFLMITYLLLAVVGGEFPRTDRYVKYLIFIGAILALTAYISSGGAVIFPGIAIRPIPELQTIFAGLTLQDIGIIILFLLTLGIIIYMTKEKETGPSVRVRP